MHLAQGFHRLSNEVRFQRQAEVTLECVCSPLLYSISSYFCQKPTKQNDYKLSQQEH